MSSRENIAGAYNLIIEDEDNGGNVTQSPVQLREGNGAEFPHELASSGSFVSEDNTPLGSSTETTGTTYSILKIRKRTKLSEENDMKNRVTWSEEFPDGPEEKATTLNSGAGDNNPTSTKDETALLPRDDAGAAKNREKQRVGRPRPPLERLKSELHIDQLSKSEIELKANLFFHIGNPIKRWKIERVIPIKLILQLLKTVCLVVQVSLFTRSIPHQRAEFFYNSREVFENHFFLDFQADKPRGVYQEFSITELFERFDFICANYYQLPNITIGGYDFKLLNSGEPAPVQMKLRQYSRVELNASSFTYSLDGALNTTIFEVRSDQVASDEYIKFSSDPLFNRFFDLVVSFPVNNIRIVQENRAECFSFYIMITFASEHDSGKINYFLREKHWKEDCNGTNLNPTSSLDLIKGFISVLDVIIILMSFFSMFLVFTTLKRALKLGKAMGTFYRDQLGIELSWRERRSLFSGWHFLNLGSDIMIIIGTATKFALDYNVIVLGSPTRILLGTAVLFQAGVMLRYVSYFKELNALNRTLYLAFPEILKFMLCAGLLFMAFSLTGFIVLGPYHPKFISFYETVETLFGLLNGDDIYATFDQIDIDDDVVAYVYSRVFLYCFLILFIYFVLNLFTSLVISAYEASQNLDNACKTEVRRFIFSGPLTPNGVALRDVTLTKKYVDPQLILQRRENKVENRKRSFSMLEGLATAA